ncbi:hypothetical protein GOP47_0022264 [Adiantum capillus-veneris]|uniref:RING-type domain-containing protein n=1 Tax=Adiantum capillus-veneris TaxID=13818 RepID=A0A9D4U9W3_ADICA|nr:hypothetical protein GOP47_0022264 [Adiantum capillus-veneris]
MASSERMVDAEQTRPGFELATSPTSSFDIKILIVATSLLLLLLSAFCFNLTLRWVLRRLHTTSSLAPAPPGLKKRYLSSIPSTLFRNLPQSQAATTPQCPICLVDFGDTERIRVLPICQHVFHVSCVDTWLVKSSSCPTCRGDLMEAMLAERPSLQVHVQIVVSSDGSLSSSLSKEDTHIKYFL